MKYETLLIVNLGFSEMIVIFCVALLVFGPKRLPELAKGLGQGIREFKKALNQPEEEAPPSPPAIEQTANKT